METPTSGENVEEIGLARRAQIVAFGKPPAEVSLVALGRAASWRVRGTAVRVGLTLTLAPIVALIPPHAPWVVAVLVGGGILARRRWTERLTVVSFDAECPRCGNPLTLETGSRLLNPHVLSCEGCHHSLTLTHSPLEAPTDP